MAAVMHQQGGWACPVVRSSADAQAFKPPQSGQRVGSALETGSDMKDQSKNCAQLTKDLDLLFFALNCNFLGVNREQNQHPGR